MRNLTWCALGLLGACAMAPTPEPNLGSYQRPITTDSVLAQQHFNRGLVLCWAFNHTEAERAFRAAIDADPRCAMAWWGVAYALGPNINKALTDVQVAQRAHEAAQRALTLAGRATVAELALITAMASRYASPPPKDRAPLDLAYADALRQAWQRHALDPEIGTLFAEALLDLRPWDQWTKDGQPQPGTEEAIEVLDTVLAGWPEHPGANHFQIHVHEASPNPERAAASAAVLASLAPGAGHLVHMPSHIWVRLGRWADAEAANVEAVAVDEAYFARREPPLDYVSYWAHNQRVLAYVAMMAGREAVARQAASAMRTRAPRAWVEARPGSADVPFATWLHVLLRFGRFAEVLAEPEPELRYPVWRAQHRYARGVALAAQGQVDAARAEFAAFDTAVAAVSEKARIGTNRAHDVLAVGRSMLAGEVAFRAGHIEQGLNELRAAVRAEDALRYSEPPGWVMPPRHALGALLLEAGQLDGAEQCYRQDLERNRDNGWALVGLRETLQRQGKAAEAAEVEPRLRAAWASADAPASVSCFCRREVG